MPQPGTSPWMPGPARWAALGKSLGLSEQPVSPSKTHKQQFRLARLCGEQYMKTGMRIALVCNCV